MRETVNISLTKKLKKEIDKVVDSGQYSSRSEFFRNLIRRWQKDQFSEPNNYQGSENVWEKSSKENFLNHYDKTDSIYDKI